MEDSTESSRLVATGSQPKLTHEGSTQSSRLVLLYHNQNRHMKILLNNDLSLFRHVHVMSVRSPLYNSNKKYDINLFSVQNFFSGNHNSFKT